MTIFRWTKQARASARGYNNVARPRLSFETLESRRLMTGSVTASALAVPVTMPSYHLSGWASNPLHVDTLVRSTFDTLVGEVSLRNAISARSAATIVTKVTIINTTSQTLDYRLSTGPGTTLATGSVKAGASIDVSVKRDPNDWLRFQFTGELDGRHFTEAVRPRSSVSATVHQKALWSPISAKFS